MNHYGNIRAIEVTIPEERMAGLYGVFCETAMLERADHENPAMQTALNAFFAPDEGAGCSQLVFTREKGGQVTLRFTSLTKVFEAISSSCVERPEVTPQLLISNITRDLDRLLGLIGEMGGKFDPNELDPILARLCMANNTAVSMKVSKEMRAAFLADDEIPDSFKESLRRAFGGDDAAKEEPDGKDANPAARAASVVDELRREMAEGPGHGGIFGGAHSGAPASKEEATKPGDTAESIDDLLAELSGV